MRNRVLSLIVAIGFIGLLSCDNLRNPQGDTNALGFSEYVQAHTNGFIASDDQIVIVLKQSLSGYKVGDQLPDDIFDFSPNLKGKAFLAEGNSVEFYPEETLENGESYDVSFRLGNLLSLPDDLTELSFEFQVLPLDFTVLKGQLDADGDVYIYSGKIQCSDQMDSEELESVFEISGGGDLELSIVPVKSKVHEYRISGIKKKESASTMLLEWNARKINVDEKGDLKINIPGLNEFVVLGVYPQQGEDQNIKIVFSGDLDKSQNLDGLIYLSDNKNFTLQVRGEEVTLYPDSRLEGECDLNIEQAVKSSAGIKLSEAEKYTLVMSPLPPEIEFLGKGYILPNTNGLLLPFRAVSLRGVDLYVYRIYANNVQQFLQRNQPQEDYNLRGSLKYVGRPVFRKTIRLDQDPTLDLSQWNSFSIDLSTLVNEDPHALYHVELRMRKTLASFVCDDSDLQSGDPIDLIPEEFDSDDLQGFNDNEYYYEDLYPENYSWRDRDDPCSESYYVPGKFKYRNVLATNLGILAKSGNQKDFTVIVTDLLSAEPVSNASVQFYNYQQQQILASMTDPDGMSEVSLDHVPYLIEVQKDNQKAFLRVDDGSALSLSNFDVAGAHIEEGIKGYIYGERGVWRPGDTLNLSFALFDKQEALPDDIPVQMEIYNAIDNLVYKSSSQNYLNGLYAFSVPTNPEDPTGNWRTVVKVGGISFEKTIKVENIRPNRLKMELDFNRNPLMPRDRQQILDFSSNWLHGAPAANMRAEIRVKLRNQKTVFKGYEEFTFSNPLSEYWPDDITIFDDLLDDEGQRILPVYLDVGPYSPGMLKAVFTSKVYERGGGFSTDVFSMPFSPYERYVGVSIPEMTSPRDQLETDSFHKVDVVTLSPSGDPVSVKYLQAKVYKIRWSWWWSSQPDNLAYYIGSQNEKLVYETAVSTSNGKGSFSFKVDYPDWGRYLVHVFDPESNHGAGQTIYMDWPAWANRDGRANPSGATMLTFTADKEEYKPGKKATLTFPSVEDARAILTLEAGDKIVYSKWIKTDDGETQVEVEMTEEMAPNVYASISMIQPHEHDGNDLPIRQYGVLRLKVNNPDSKLKPEIEIPEEIRPNSEYSIKVSEAKGKAMNYTLAIVDEGLLNLTRFKTPDPWSDFYAQEALGMKTWDMFDDVIGAYGGRIESLLAIGGDEGEIQDDAKKANRFTPVVTFLGPFELKKNRSQKHDITMPNYVGEVRAMVIAGDKTAWGSAEAKAFVRQPLMVLTALPRKLSPGEQVDLPVSVFVMKEGMKTAKVTVTTEGPVKCVGDNEVTISATDLGEQMVYFPIETGDENGVAKIIVKVQSGDEQAEHTTEMQVLNPNPYVYNTVQYVLEEGEELNVPVSFHGSAGTNSASLTVSGLPSFNLEENLQYLIKYPYGCLEQISSSAFVQLMLDQLSDLSETQKLESDNNIRATIRKIPNYQLASGGLALWPGTSGASLWAGSYAGHFMLLAEQKGYVIPGLVKDKWLKFQKARVNSYSNRSDYLGDSDLQQAYRLYTLALANQPDLSAMNRLKESDDMNKAASWRLAAAYAILGKDEVALQLINNNSNEEFQKGKSRNTFGSALRDQAMMMETLILLDKKTEAYAMARKLIDGLKSMRWSTQTTAYSLMALGQLSGESGKDEMLKFSLTNGSGTEKVNTQKMSWILNLDESKADQTVKVENRNDAPIFLEFTACGQSAEGLTEASSNGLTLDFRFTDMSGEVIDPSEITQGTSFNALVLIQNPAQNGALENLALSQVFPSGWEIISTRYAEDEDNSNSIQNTESPFTYRDIKDDRVHTFFSIDAGAKAIYKVKLNAAYAGKFIMPAITVEAMYQPELHANSSNSHVEVIRNR